MINAIEIKNFKSAEKLDLEFGRVNTFIGENGSGKSTILEALAFAVAAENDKLDAEFLENRGVRVTIPEFMRSQFKDADFDRPIEIELLFGDKGESRKYIIDNKNKTFSEWKVAVIDDAKLLSDGRFGISKYGELNEKAMQLDRNILKLKERLDIKNNDSDKEIDMKQLLLDANKAVKEALESMADVKSTLDVRLTKNVRLLQNFAIYTPENKQLRNLKEEGSLRPVGVQGQGLFRLLRQIAKEQPEALVDIEEGLRLIGWYEAESMDLEKEPELIEDELFIKDRFLSKPFTQRSVNEGFLYVLFYISLIVSEATPKIFAIDNLDSALNPKLCTKLMEYIYALACKYDKQIFLTTHNPALLDGINLNDDQQKLFVVSRAKQGGQTRVKIITADKKLVDSDGDSLRLSEAMLRGYLGGLPKGF